MHDWSQDPPKDPEPVPGRKQFKPVKRQLPEYVHSNLEPVQRFPRLRRFVRKIRRKLNSGGAPMGQWPLDGLVMWPLRIAGILMLIWLVNVGYQIIITAPR